MSIGNYGVEFIHTPGHSPGSMCLRVTNGINEENISDILLITGDTVFPVSIFFFFFELFLSWFCIAVQMSNMWWLYFFMTDWQGSCGRLDLPGSDKHIMYDSLQKLSTLNNSLPIYPGHGYGGMSSTIGQEKKSGLLQSFSREQWKSMMG